MSKQNNANQASTLQGARPMAQAQPASHRVLKRNHGSAELGRSHVFYPAGTVLHAERDRELIAQMQKQGAVFEPTSEALGASIAESTLAGD
jgi:hypothetical protein